MNHRSFNILVVDNAPNTGESRAVADLWQVDYMVEPVVGLSRSRNAGARISTSEVVVFLDDDAICETDWLSQLLCEFRDPFVMVVTGRIATVGSEAEPNGMSAHDSWWQQRRVVDSGTPGWFEMANFGGLGDGSNMAFRREVFDDWTGFDERLGRGATIVGGEEHLALFCLIERGYRVVYTPEAVVHHPAPRTLEQLQRRALRDASSAMAYFTLLFVEHSRYRFSIARYLAGAVVRVQRPWSAPHGKSPPRVISRRCTFVAYVRGLLLYFASRFSLDARRLSDASMATRARAVPTISEKRQRRSSWPLGEARAQSTRRRVFSGHASKSMRKTEG